MPEESGPGPEGFFKNLLHTAINAGVMSLIWRIGTVWLVLLLALMIGLVLYFKWY